MEKVVKAPQTPTVANNIKLPGAKAEVKNPRMNEPSILIKNVATCPDAPKAAPRRTIPYRRTAPKAPPNATTKKFLIIRTNIANPADIDKLWKHNPFCRLSQTG